MADTFLSKLNPKKWMPWRKAGTAQDLEEIGEILHTHFECFASFISKKGCKITKGKYSLIQMLDVCVCVLSFFFYFLFIF